jgi:UDPglucose 6-dehydrogenase
VVVGAGCVGLTTGACLAALGIQVVCADSDAAKVYALNRGQISILEPGLPERVEAGLRQSRLRFVVGASTAVQALMPRIDAVYICVPTPLGSAGEVELAQFKSVVLELKDLLPPGCTVVTKSTVPVGTTSGLHKLFERSDLHFVSNPEFLREGSAVRDFMYPDRIVVGADDPDAALRIARLYNQLSAPLVLTDCASAEMIKYAANAFLAVKLSYVNSLADLCARLGVSIGAVTEGIGLDSRIGREFLRPGPGWGGPCLPKDIATLLTISDSAGMELPVVRAAVEVNNQRHFQVIDLVRNVAGGSLQGAIVGLLGLAFKAGTNDLRGSPAVHIATQLAAEGAHVIAYDPSVTSLQVGLHGDSVEILGDPYSVAEQSDAVAVLVDWPELRSLDWHRMASLLPNQTIIDTRYFLEPHELGQAGITVRWPSGGSLKGSVCPCCGESA